MQAGGQHTLSRSRNVLTRPSKPKFREAVGELRKTEPKTEDEEQDLDTSAIETFNPYGTANWLLDIPLHGAYQMRNASRASSVSGPVCIYSGGSTFEIPIIGDYELQAGSAQEEDKSHVDARSPYFPYPEDCQNSYFGIMMSYVGTSPLEPLHSLPIEATKRNAELMHMCALIFSLRKKNAN
jgi:hypothetical protein